jgi:hypothetical protein
MVDLDKVKAFAAERGEELDAGELSTRSLANLAASALRHIEALVAEVERLREHNRGLTEGLLADLVAESQERGEYGSPAIIVPGNRPAVEVREDDGDAGDPAFVPLPRDGVRLWNNGVQCDSLKGPCRCGSWH